jgi:hypothetical protein
MWGPRARTPMGITGALAGRLPAVGHYFGSIPLVFRTAAADEPGHENGPRLHLFCNSEPLEHSREIDQSAFRRVRIDDRLCGLSLTRR